MAPSSQETSYYSHYYTVPPAYRHRLSPSPPPSTTSNSYGRRGRAAITSIYHHDPTLSSFWECDLVVSLASLTLWPALLMSGTLYSMLIVTLFRIYHITIRLLRCLPALSSKLTSTSSYEEVGEEEVESGLYFFGRGNICEKCHGPYNSRFFDPGRPSVIYVHGFQRRTTARRFRETLNWADNDQEHGLDVNAADEWIDNGWNVGVFYWNAYADEEFPQDSECKIWVNHGRTGMRWRAVTSTGQVTYIRSPGDKPSVAQQLAEALAEVFAYSTSTYRLVGHSLGSQLVIHASKLLLDRSIGDPSIRLPSRLAILDPFWTVGLKVYLGGVPVIRVIQQELRELRDHGVVLEQYQTSLIGRRGLRLKDMTVYIELNPAHIPWYKLKARHIAAPYLYFLSFAEEVSPQTADLLRLDCQPSRSTLSSPSTGGGKLRQTLRLLVNPKNYQEVVMDALPALAKAHDDDLRMLMGQGVIYRQYRGHVFVRLEGSRRRQRGRNGLHE